MTPTQRQAMEQALEALEHHTAIKHPQQRHYRDAAIDAIRAALAETAEPVFWYRPRSDGMYEGPIHNTQIERVRKESGGWVPLYTAPQPPAPAVRLTDEDIDALAEAHRSEYGQLCDRLDLQMFARAAIAAHGAKKGNK